MAKKDTNGSTLQILDFGMAFNIKTPGLKILVADDDPPTRQLLIASLTQWGYEVVEAANGEEAWNILLQPDPPRLLILDWLMPMLDGINLCTKVRKELIEGNSYYIILLSQISGGANIKIAIEAGANEFLTKPFDYQELRSRVYLAAKLIAFEMELVEQNSKLRHDVHELNELSYIILAMSMQMNEIIATHGEDLQPQHFQKIQQGLEKAVEVIKKFKTHHGY